MEYLHGGDIYTEEGLIDFSANINPLGPGEAVLLAAREAVSKIGRYPDPDCRRLRRILAQAQGIQEGELIFGNGAAELIFTLIMAEKPKKAVLTAPSFAEYQRALLAAGSEILFVPLKESQGFSLDESYLDYLGPDIDLIFLCSPNNPVGNVTDRRLLLKILEACRKYRIRMVMDECFYEFLENWQQETLLLAAFEYPELFILRAFTKMQALPGLRLGYGICTDPSLMKRMALVRQPWNVSVVAEEAGIAALLDRERADKTRLFVKAERERLTLELRRIGVRYYPPQANYILLRSGYDLFSLLKERGLLIRDCSNYEGLGPGYYRIAVRGREDNQRLLDELALIYGSKIQG